MVYKEKDSDRPARSWPVEGNTSHSVQLSGLGKYVLYDIQVLAFTRIGDGRSSLPSILERTLDDGKEAEEERTKSNTEESKQSKNTTDNEKFKKGMFEEMMKDVILM